MTWLAGESTSRPGANPAAWWNRNGQRRLTVEVNHLIWEAPLDLGSDERWFLWMLWRHDQRLAWPADAQWARRFGVQERTIRRWRQRLVEAGTLEFHRPHNSPGNPKWRYQASGVYDLKPPSQWRYLNDWRYAGAEVGWVDAHGSAVAWPPPDAPVGAKSASLDETDWQHEEPQPSVGLLESCTDGQNGRDRRPATIMARTPSPSTSPDHPGTRRGRP